jgi:CheY-like chemotaxis protein
MAFLLCCRYVLSRHSGIPGLISGGSAMLFKTLSKAEKTRKILIVDDEPDVIMFISRYLMHNDYNVITAENGKEALQKIADDEPDLVLLDARMPVIDGWDTLERIRKTPHSRDIPVIMVTACTQKRDIDEAAAWGVDDYITKPFDPADLIEKIAEVLKSKDK